MHAVADAMHLERRGLQLRCHSVLGRLMDRAHHPVAVPLRGLAGRMMQQQSVHPARAPVLPVIFGRAHHHQIGGLRGFPWRAPHVEGLHVQGDAEILADDHAGGDDLHLAAPVGQQLGDLVA